jgi:hypothetical protein
MDGIGFQISWAVVLEYDRYLREGGEFDRDVAEFRWWRRTARRGI